MIGDKIRIAADRPRTIDSTQVMIWVGVPLAWAILLGSILLRVLS
jgi:hypothetical protein